MSSIAFDINNHNITTFSDCYTVQHKPGASLVEPINGFPFVNVLERETRSVTRHTFKPDNRESGTDALRARILAGQFYRELH